ncbi:MAG TPA: hypothetical protein VFX57_04370, partial [Sulfuricurvum sp.]|nr:hypothetical protein [Sulfuricurvum sp.]
MQMPLNDDTTGPKFKRTKRWIIRLYLVLHAFILLTVFVIAGAIFIAFKPDSLSFVTTHLLEPLGIHFSHSEGSLSEGFTLHGVHTEAIDADTLSLDYNLTTILKGQHIIDNITIDGLRIHLNDFIGDSGSSLPLPRFTLKSVTLTNLQLISDYPIELDIRAKNGSYDGNRLYFSSVQASIKSRYASGALQGRVKDNILTGDALVYPNAKELHDYVGRFTTLPASQRITIDELSNNRVSLHTAISRLDTVQDPHTSLQNITVGMNYVYDDHYLDFNARYTLIRDQEQMQTSQNLRYALNGVTTSAVKGFITSSHPLPSHLLEGRFRDDAAGFAGKIMLGDTVLGLQSDDYDTFVWNLETVHPHLNFLPYLPEALRHSPFTLSAKGSYTVENQRLIGNVNAHHNHADFNGTLRNEAETFLVQGDLFLLPDAPTWGKWSLKPPSHLELSLNRHHGVTHLNLNADALALSLEQTDHHLKGSGNYLGSYFDISGIQSELHSDVTITSFTPSLWKTLQHIHPIELSKGEYYDAEVRTVTHI